jgi:hypothetical protein
MGDLLFWLGIGAAQKGAGSKPIERRQIEARFGAADAGRSRGRISDVRARRTRLPHDDGSYPGAAAGDQLHSNRHGGGQ